MEPILILPTSRSSIKSDTLNSVVKSFISDSYVSCFRNESSGCLRREKVYI